MLLIVHKPVLTVWEDLVVAVIVVTYYWRIIQRVAVRE